MLIIIKTEPWPTRRNKIWKIESYFCSFLVQINIVTYLHFKFVLKRSHLSINYSEISLKFYKSNLKQTLYKIERRKIALIHNNNKKVIFLSEVFLHSEEDVWSNPKISKLCSEPLPLRDFGPETSRRTDPQVLAKGWRTSRGFKQTTGFGFVSSKREEEQTLCPRWKKRKS